MWFTIWSVLVVGTLVGAFFLGRDLWRKAKALLRQMSESSQVMDRFARRTDELTAAQPSTAPTLFDDPVLLHERVEELRAERAERRAQRRTRNKVTWDRWRRFNA
ncbi:hypothetical protein ACWFNS_03225 [Oerskovia enterophila]